MTRISASDRRSALVGAALRVVADRGVTAATTRAIVAEAGMSLASFHYAFESRDELMTELIRSVVAAETTAVMLADAPAPGRPDPDALRRILREGLLNYADHLCGDPMREKAMLELTQYALRSPGMRHLAREQYAGYHALAARALEAAARQSESESSTGTTRPPRRCLTSPRTPSPGWGGAGERCRRAHRHEP